MKPLPRLTVTLLLLVATVLCLPLLAQAQQTALTPNASQFRYRRTLAPVPIPPGGVIPSRSCAMLDAAVYAHAEPSLSDVRLFATSPIGPEERPYALTSSQTEPNADTAQALNLGVSKGHISFDLAMPPRAYSEVDLQLDDRDFVGTATVSGRHALEAGERPVALGSFTVFDLTGQRLGRSTMLPLVESTFAFLHVELTLSGADGHPFDADSGMVHGAFIPPSREAQILYTTVAESTQITHRGKQTVVTLELPAKVPVEQVELVLAAGDKTNFSRDVTVSVFAPRGAVPPPDGQTQDGPREQFTGEIARVHITSFGREVKLDNLRIPATIGLNIKDKVRVEVSVANGDDQPIPIVGVRLEMRQRRICFNTPQGALTMFYGADKLEAPVYDFSRLFNPAEQVQEAALTAELVNAAYKAPPAVLKPFTERHPEVLWLALLIVILSLGRVAFRSVKRI